jgi:outer membrane protein
MKIKTFALTLALFAALAAPAFAQVRIGYTNIEVILAYMPEAKTVESQLQLFQQKLGEKLKAKEDYAQLKLQEYQECVENNTCSPTERQTREAELTKLDQELRKLAEQSEFDLLAKRQELMEPMLQKLQDAIDATAKEKGYTYILNQTTSGGVSTILYGPEEDEITEAVMKRLGITVPQN